ncbi:uncharacterized protein PHALS_11268 [Plasmopara halstedii]|uniref:Uncharacterized protein n=1 Tax=Plasmopara halstedii TaxID=4781 RepID=A0A0P1AJH1_PLAHL|nr:uncharacterized protein PHALS_11268 [Plasmopara halstedii]CEG41103.1 hypothetical protein PHALS_11268 [Plasmopara halstedii]|eukprot:XP_024577472.1 hypothetical protein PHALS_11268 [Plasmopara halstedii]
MTLIMVVPDADDGDVGKAASIKVQAILPLIARVLNAVSKNYGDMEDERGYLILALTCGYAT